MMHNGLDAGQWTGPEQALALCVLVRLAARLYV
jgi:hypothetical protein